MRVFAFFWQQSPVFSLSQVGFRNESCVEIGCENAVLGMFTPGGHVALEDIHHTLSSFEFTFLSSVLSTSSVRAMSKGVVAQLVNPVTKLHLCRNMPTFVALITDLKYGEIITEMLSVCRVTARLSENRQGERVRMAVSALDVLTDR